MPNVLLSNAPLAQVLTYVLGVILVITFKLATIFACHVSTRSAMFVAQMVCVVLASPVFFLTVLIHLVRLVTLLESFNIPWREKIYVEAVHRIVLPALVLLVEPAHAPLAAMVII